jgi:PEP-CTERM motif
MRRILMMALAGAGIAAMPTAPAQAALTLTLVGTLNGNQCGGGPITTCFANGTTALTGSLTQVGANGNPVPGSPGILRLANTGSGGGLTDSILNDILTINYTGSTVAHWIGLFNGGSAVGCTGTSCFNNTYFLFYSANPITSGTIDLNLYFQNSGISHVDLFDTGGPSVPEPATWALMLLGFGGIGLALRRRRTGLLQIA